MKYENRYSLGLDIGSASIGWALLDLESEKILRLGVRKFSEPREPKTGATLASKRREKRALRRNLRRKAFRKERLLKRMCQRGLISKEQFAVSRSNRPEKNNIFYGTLKSPWQLRAEGLTRCLEKEEWARVIFHLVKHRGYQSNSIEKEKKETTDSESKKILNAIQKNDAEFQEFFKDSPQAHHTIGEFFYLKFPNKKRNSTDDYIHTIGREKIEEELDILFSCQEKLGNPFADSDFHAEVRTILNSRRHYASGPGGDSPYGGDLIGRMVGECTLDPSQGRAPKESYAGVQFRLYQTLNNIRVGGWNQQNTPLSAEQKEKAAQKAMSLTSFSYSQLRTAIGLEDAWIFKGLRYNLSARDIGLVIYKSDKELYRRLVQGQDNATIRKITEMLDRKNTLLSLKEKEEQLKEKFQIPEKTAKKLIQEVKNPESKVILKRDTLQKVEKILAKYGEDASGDRLNAIIFILTVHREQDAFNKLEQLGIHPEACKALAMESSSGFLHLSVKTINRLLPHLKEGLTYDKACAREGFDHAQSQLDRGNINNPTVFRAFKQTQKLMGAIIKEYGYPKDMYLEVARDLNHSRKEKNERQKEMEANESRRRIGEEIFVSAMGREPVGRESQIWRFYNEQNGQCLYCGNALGDLNTIFSQKGAPAIEIEHTLPYSRSLDNRQCNMTAACIHCNREKGNRTPFEFFGSNTESNAWVEFTARCSKIRDRSKKALLLVTDWDEEGSGERQLNDTRYISRLVQSWLESAFQGRFIATAKAGETRNLFTVKGGATSLLRRIWGLERIKYNAGKERENERNHALDAAIVVAATHKYNQVISRKNRRGEIEGQFDTARRPNKQIRDLLPPPWPTFAKELRAFLGYGSENRTTEEGAHIILDGIPGANEKYDVENHPIAPLFVSWMPRRGVRGAVHKETIYRVQTIKETLENGDSQEKQIYFKKIRIQNLNADNIDRVAGRFDAQTGEETPFYKALRERLKAFNHNGEKAFAEPLRKGTGRHAPEVKKVRIREEVGGGMPILKGAAQNGDMIRVDVFRRYNKKGMAEYYLVPIYTKHRVEPSLPMQAIATKKPESQWPIMEEKEFFCSLYPEDYVEITKEKNVRVTDDAAGPVQKKQQQVDAGYYMETHRAGASITLHPHDSRKVKIRMGIKKDVVHFKKFHVDVLGNRTQVRLPEKRVPLQRPGQKG